MKQLLLVLALGMFIAIPTTTDAAACALTPDNAYKSPRDASVYYITDSCTKRPFKSSKLYFTYFDSWDETIIIDDMTLASIANDPNGLMPYGPKFTPSNGDVIKTLNDPKVYFVIGNELRHIADEASYIGLGYKWNWILNVDERIVNRYSKGESVSFFTYQPNYALFKQSNDPKVYRIEPHPQDPKRKSYRHIANETVFKSLGYRFDRVLEVDPIPEPEIDEDGSIVFRSQSLSSGINPMSTLPEASPITTPGEAQNIDIQNAISTEKSRALVSGNYLRDEPLYGISFEYPKSFTITEAYPGIESLTATYQISFTSDEYPNTSVFFNATPLTNPVVSVMDAPALKAIYDSAEEREAFLESKLHGASLFGNIFSETLIPYTTTSTVDNFLNRYDKVIMLEKAYAEVTENDSTITAYPGYSIGFTKNDTLYVFGATSDDPSKSIDELKQLIMTKIFPTISIKTRVE